MSMMYRQPQAAQTAYAAQAAKWRNNAESPWKTGGTSSSASNSVSELVLISELCSSIGQTSFPPKDAMTTLMRHIQALDHTYLCELLETKLEDSLWQVVARALAVLDALLWTAAATTYLDYFSSRKNLLQHLTDHAKQTVKSRAEKVFHVLDAHVPTQASHDEDSDDDDDYRGDHPSIYQRSAQQQRAPSSSTNRAPADAAVVAVQHIAVVADFSIYTSRAVADPVVVVRVFVYLSVGHDDAADDDAGADPFGSTLGDTSSSRGDMSEQDTDGRSEVSEDVHHVQHDRALRAAATMSTRDEFEALKKAGMAREVILEVDVPPGPMGIVLDRTTPESAILAEFVPLPSGDKGLIELHPAICPGCLLVAINGNSIEHVALPELGPVLANAAMYHRVLTFKKFMVGSRVMHPLKLKTPYTCPAPSLFDQVSSPRLTATRASWSSSPPSGPRPTPVHQSQPFEHVPATFAAAQRAFTTASSTNSSVPFRFMQQQQAAVVASPRHDPPTTSAFGFMAATQPPPSRPFSPAQHPRQPPSSPSAFSFI
ncbi:hypothetical protein DYB32_006554 [Aphanomyces invadans]|uniref:Uncharacterized protein n=1 Tax=Aphanomyces invadans TaxID=157072 RepID=A0A418ARC1_9STRA|nr:hypothetical protein DYB32_006554 [Aphanomyces invadans]